MGDTVAAFGYRWHLSADDDEFLAKLDYNSLRHVFQGYDKTRPLQELVDEVPPEITAEGGDVSLARQPGLFVLGRLQCLELLDPLGDALVLGDANLSFALQLAEHRESLSHTGRIVATTFETLETLQERSPEIDATVSRLDELG